MNLLGLKWRQVIDQTGYSGLLPAGQIRSAMNGTAQGDHFRQHFFLRSRFGGRHTLAPVKFSSCFIQYFCHNIETVVYLSRADIQVGSEADAPGAATHDEYLGSGAVGDELRADIGVR